MKRDRSMSMSQYTLTLNLKILSRLVFCDYNIIHVNEESIKTVFESSFDIITGPYVKEKQECGRWERDREDNICRTLHCST